MSFEDWCAMHGYDPTDEDLRSRFETFQWYTDAVPSRELSWTP